MFERFTDRARRVIVLAQEEARMAHHDSIDATHLLIGIVAEGESLGAQVLAQLGIDSPEIVVEAAGPRPRSASAPSGHIPFTPDTKKILELSLREALQLGHGYIGTEHLLLAIVRHNDNSALVAIAGILGLTPEDAGNNLRLTVIQRLSGYIPTPTKSAAPANFDIAAVKRRVGYNSHDLGEFGKMIRLQYVHNILDDITRGNTVTTPGELDALPEGSAIRDADGIILTKLGPDDDPWLEPGGSTLPPKLEALVIWRPDWVTA
ncbi:Clp protease N-terminal domain-containing protein [Mycolicibacterium sphagni]|uniref:Clp protease N-terminal domain-containing protein n=1 Tax=Mycolicibacterium sphagni TaxID=1786 RepID=UPI0021F32A3C|nr:Clp protease N-terminal domain-containing protein [Mycolicibacterium sphagni]MCV7175097.1 hypothetical protein [Mycolicibacterium sphagni]